MKVALMRRILKGWWKFIERMRDTMRQTDHANRILDISFRRI